MSIPFVHRFIPCRLYTRCQLLFISLSLSPLRFLLPSVAVLSFSYLSHEFLPSFLPSPLRSIGRCSLVSCRHITSLYVTPRHTNSQAALARARPPTSASPRRSTPAPHTPRWGALRDARRDARSLDLETVSNTLTSPFSLCPSFSLRSSPLSLRLFRLFLLLFFFASQAAVTRAVAWAAHLASARARRSRALAAGRYVCLLLISVSVSPALHLTTFHPSRSDLLRCFTGCPRRCCRAIVVRL